MFSGLLIILVPLIVGYLIPLRHRTALQLINRLLSWIVYLILFFMGISLAFLDNLASNLLAILHYSAVSVTVIILCNIAALFWLERSLPWRHNHKQEKLPSRIAMALESLQLCGVVVIGFLLGLTGLPILQHATEASEYTLIFLLFLVGSTAQQRHDLKANCAEPSGDDRGRRRRRQFDAGGGYQCIDPRSAAENRAGDGIRFWLVFPVRYSVDRIVRTRNW
jgi:uncharacterized membrane protein YbjE (DUF340 family)